MRQPRFVLASASSARKRLLQSVGIEPIVRPSDFDESRIQLRDPLALVEELALGKANVIVPQFADTHALVMGCDSVLAIQGEIYGKPETPEVAIARWQTMRGQVGQLYTGHALIDTQQQRTVVQTGITQVYFADICDREIEAYVATGEPLNCAGCFALEGKGGAFVEKIDGCHSNVIGLSLPLLRQIMMQLGYQITDFW
ncbi:MAG: Maf family protein [Thainema sp.]